jgi:hypothetical protein
VAARKRDGCQQFLDRKRPQGGRRDIGLQPDMANQHGSEFLLLLECLPLCKRTTRALHYQAP